MKTIGLIGGMSWESTALYYGMLNQEVRKRQGGLHSAKCIVYSVDFAEVERLQARDQWDEAGAIVLDCAQHLVCAGAELIVLTSNTMHIAAPQLEENVEVPFLHIADTAAAKVTGAGVSRVGLLGTAFTMEKEFYRQRLSSHGLEVVIPDDDDRRAVHDIIFDELCLGEIREESRDKFRSIVGRLVAMGAEGIVSGCTEIELLIDQTDCSVPLFPTARLHVEAAIDAAMS